MKVNDIMKENLFVLAHKIRTSINELSTDKISEMFNQKLNSLNKNFLEETFRSKDFLRKDVGLTQWSKFTIMKNLDLGFGNNDFCSTTTEISKHALYFT